MSDLLAVEGLRTLFRTDGGEFAAVDGVSFSVAAGRTLAIVELPTNRLPLLRPLFSGIAATVESITPSAYVQITF